MIRVGVIWNPNSHRNVGVARAPVPDDVIAIEPESESELYAALRRLAADGVNLIVIDGGDGTIREVLTRLPEAYHGELPRIAILPNGKTNALALDIGVPVGMTLEDLLVSARSPRAAKRRHCLEVLRAGQGLPERRGFLFGAGAFVKATNLAQRHHANGLIDNAAVAVTLGGAAMRTLLGGGHDSWARGEDMQVSFVPDVERWFLLLASTLKRLPLGLRPFGEPREGLKALAVEAPPRRLLQALPPILTGRDPAWLAERGYHRADLPELSLAFDGDFVLDGEVYEGGALSLRRGPELELVVP